MNTDEDAMLDRADRWLGLIDTDEYRTDAKLAQSKIPDVKGKRSGPFSDFLSRTMTNYQSLKGMYYDFRNRAKEGRLSSDKAYLAGSGIPLEEIDRADQYASKEYCEEVSLMSLSNAYLALNRLPDTE